MTTTQDDGQGFRAVKIAAAAVAAGEDPVSAVLGQLAGYASTCWQPGTGDAVFDSGAAADAVESAVRWVQTLVAVPGGRTVHVKAGQGLVLRITEGTEGGLDELMRAISDGGPERVMVVAPEIEAYVVDTGAEVTAELVVEA